MFVENREAVLAALQEGRCDRILPAARGFLDGFAEFCLRAGVLKAFEAFPDHRAQRSAFPCSSSATRWYRPLWHLPAAAARSRTPCSARPTYCGLVGVQRA